MSVLSRSLLIEGWRGFNHSIALVNQHQIVELLKLEGLTLYHHDLPPAFAHWTRSLDGSGLDAADARAIDAVPSLPAGATVDCVYRICAPIRAGEADDRRRTLTFMITELGLGAGSFAGDAGASDFFTRGDNAIVTASEWSRQRLIDHGYASGKVAVVPLGVDCAAFTPQPEAERMLHRAQLGFAADETVFVNVGGAFWNKGIDVLLRAFAVLRARGRRVCLVLKDQRDLYGVSIEGTLRAVAADCPELLRPETLAAIRVIPGRLDRSQLRVLYNIADAYVSPYRAEGFNLPALEAIACATPLIVTRGGATDDFCNDDVAWRIPGRECPHPDPRSGIAGRCVEPDLDALVSAMQACADGVRLPAARYDFTREDVLRRFTWANAASRLAGIAVGLEARPSAPAPAAVPSTRGVQQQEVLRLLARLSPLAMANGTKVRVGNTYDGGYVLPSHALACDAVLSIGVGHDVSFDLAFAERGATVMQFDHTVEASPSAHANFRFHKLGWGADTAGDLLSFADMRRMFDTVPARRPMLKFDVEGAEYEAFAAMADDELADFEVIVCELHDLSRLGERGMFARVQDMLDKLTRRHAPVHLHANNYRGVALVAGVPVPEVMELTLLRRDLDQFPRTSDEAMPGVLDHPNNPNAADICLRVF